MENIYTNKYFLIAIISLIFLAILFLLLKSIIKFTITSLLIFVVFFGAVQGEPFLEKYGDKLTPTQKTTISKISKVANDLNKDYIDDSIDEINKIADDSNDKMKDALDIIEQMDNYNNEE